MKKKLLALVLSVVMLVSLLVPVIVSSAEGNPVAKIGLGEVAVQELKGVKYLTIPVVIAENSAELIGLRYQVISVDGVAPYNFRIGDYKGSYEDDFGDVYDITFEATTNKEMADRLQILHAGSSNEYGITTKAGTLGAAWFVAPTEVGTYQFEIVVGDASCYVRDANGTPSASPAEFGYTTQKVTYTVECTEHIPGAAEQTKAPTCTDKGEEVVKCTACGKVMETKEIAALGHKAGEAEQTKAPDCDDKGEEVVKCTVCGEVIETNEIAALGHDLVDDAEANKEATCTEAGIANAKKCTRCDYKTHDDVAALGHAWNEGVVDGDAKCGDKAKITYTCLTCGEIRVEEGALVEHVLVKDEEASVDPTCTDDGVEVLKCTREGCEYTESAVVEKLGHDMVADEANSKAATCTEAGVAATKCSRCDVTDSEEIEALGHDMVVDEANSKAATCTEAGVAATKCSRCDVTDSEEIAALGHKAGEAEETKAPTCTEKGEAVVKCTVCKEVLETKELDVVAHTEGEKVIVKAPTDAEEGKWEVKCTVCDALIASGAIAKLEKVIEDKENGFTFEAESAKLPSDFTADVETNEEEGKVTVTLNFKSEIVDLKGEVVMTIDTAIFTQFKKLAVFTTNAAGELVEVQVEIKDGVATFNADLEKEYVFAEAEEEKPDDKEESPGTSDNSNVAVFAVVALMAVAALVVVGKKRFAL